MVGKCLGARDDIVGRAYEAMKLFAELEQGDKVMVRWRHDAALQGLGAPRRAACDRVATFDWRCMHALTQHAPKS